ncbi:MAG: hypothetical protein WAX04_08165 [Oscillospiraceae bacterium]
MNLFKKTVIPFVIICIMFTSSTLVYGLKPTDWYEVKGTYAKDDNSQYDCGTLSLMYLDNDVVMFEFFMMEGSESENTSNNFCLAGAFYLDDNGIGIYEHPKTGNVKITFNLSDNQVSVKQTGKLPIDVSGNYKFIEDHINVTEDAAIEILEQLPTATTSLNHNNGEYKLQLSEEMIDGWFYDVKASFVDTNALIAEFYISGDMSAVYRIDTGTPILIWGSAKPMIDATYLSDSKSLFGVTEDENNSNVADEDENYVKTNYVSIIPQNDAIAIGDSTPTVITVPGNLNYTLTCKSSDPEIAKIDEKGVITVVADGEAIITGMITIDGAEKPFEFTVSSFDKKATMDNINSTFSSSFLWIIIPVIILILLVVFIIIKTRKNKNSDI